MKKSILFTFFFISLTLFGLAQPSKKEQAVLDLSKRKFDWTIKKQLDSLSVILDDRVKYIHSNGWTQSKQEIINDFKSGKLSYQGVDIKDATVRLYENTAIVTGIGKFSGTLNNNPFSMDLTYTEVYVNKKNHWLLASRHANKMP